MKLLTGISPKTPADRLKEQEKAGLVKGEAFAEIPPRVEYCLTQDGIDVRNTILLLMEWVYKKSVKDKKILS